MGPMCASGAHIPTGFNVSDGDHFVAMCNEVVYYKNTFNVNGQLYTTGEGPADYLQAYIGNKTIPWLRHAAKEAVGGGRPFFAYLAPHAPHFPAQPAPWYMHAALPSQTAPRLPSYNNFTEGKSWAIRTNPPLDAFTADAVDLHYRNRLRSLLSVDDYIHDIFQVLEQTGALNSTFVITTSDHGYHLGNYRVPYEKSLPYDIDVRVPFFVRGPGVPMNTTSPAIVSLMDVGATVLELAGVTQPGQRTTDGRSIVPTLQGSAVPTGWREGTLVEFVGYPNQWMEACNVVFGIANCPSKADVPYLIDGPQNTYSMLRIINATHDLTYAEFRPEGSPIALASTNWTELYDNKQDPWQSTNIAARTSTQALQAQLWAVATCSADSCL
jgi:N-acetylglucosamine-6-sulfatase